MKKGYIGHNQYRYRYFKSPLGNIKFLLDVFIGPNFINISESNIDGEVTEESARQYALAEIERNERKENGIMARTLLTYSVLTEDVWDDKKNAIVRKVKHRGFDFSVSGVKSRKEETAYLDSFVKYLLEETGIDARGNYFGGGGRQYVDRTSGEKVESSFVYIGIRDMEQKAEVQQCYQRWKKEIKPAVTW